MFMWSLRDIIKSAWDEFIYGGHLLSLGASSIVYTSAVLLDIKITWDFLIVVYLSVQAPYLYNRYKEFSKDYLTNPERTRFVERKMKLLPFLIFLYFIAFILILLFFGGFKAFLFGFFLSLLSFLYSKFFKGLTKNILGFKNFTVSFLWTLFVPFLTVYYSYPLNVSVFLIFLFVFFRLFIHEAFFDIKDIESDKREKLLTFPIFLGKEKLINTLNVINIFSIFPIILGVYFNLFSSYSLILFLTILYSMYYLRQAKCAEYDQNFLYNVIGDGEFILWIFYIFLGKTLL